MYIKFVWNPIFKKINKNKMTTIKKTFKNKRSIDYYKMTINNNLLKYIYE